MILSGRLSPKYRIQPKRPGSGVDIPLGREAGYSQPAPPAADKGDTQPMRNFKGKWAVTFAYFTLIPLDSQNHLVICLRLSACAGIAATAHGSTVPHEY